MKIAISSTGDSLTSAIDFRFGRCPYFIIYNIDSEDFEVLDNGAYSASGGAGVQAAQAVVNSGAEAVLTGNVGPKALQALEAAGLSVYPGARGTVKESIAEYIAGELDSTAGPTVGSHYGMGKEG
jgi:predicted Fe-Mo cluster-binding NifX family protein